MERLINGEFLTINQVFAKYEMLINKLVAASISKGSSSERDDLFEEALCALKAAYLKFDDSKGIKFITYATTIIQNRLKEFNRIDRNIVIPKDKYYSKDLNKSHLSTINSLDYLIDSEHSQSDITPADINNPNYNPEVNNEVYNIRRSIYNLKGIEKEVALLKFGFTERGVLKNTEIASILKIKPVEVVKIYNSLLSKLKSQLTSL